MQREKQQKKVGAAGPIRDRPFIVESVPGKSAPQAADASPDGKGARRSKMAKAGSLYSNFTVVVPREYSIGDAHRSSSDRTVSRVDVQGR